MNRTPTRLLMTADTVGGVWTYAVTLCRALQPHGVEVVLATMGGPLSDAQQDAADALPNVEVRPSTYRLEWMNEPWDDVEAAGDWLMDLAEETQPDLVHLNNYAHGHLPWNTPVLMVGHSCVYSWFEAVYGESPPEEEWGRYREAVAAGVHAADAVTAPTAAMLHALKRHYGSFCADVPIYNARRPADYPPGDPEPIVLTAGRLWDEAKNTAALEAAAPVIDWSVCVAGEDQHPDSGGRATFDGLRLLGRLAPDELAGWMGRAAIYALPARYEPFGLSALEAALAGCALVLSDIPSLREVWGDAACFVPPDDTDALAATLQRLIGDDAFRRMAAGRARRRALTYTPERMAESYLDLYARLLREGERRPATDDAGPTVSHVPRRQPSFVGRPS